MRLIKQKKNLPMKHHYSVPTINTLSIVHLKLLPIFFSSTLIYWHLFRSLIRLINILCCCCCISCYYWWLLFSLDKLKLSQNVLTQLGYICGQNWYNVCTPKRVSIMIFDRSHLITREIWRCGSCQRCGHIGNWNFMCDMSATTTTTKISNRWIFVYLFFSWPLQMKSISPLAIILFMNCFLLELIKVNAKRFENSCSDRKNDSFYL